MPNNFQQASKKTLYESKLSQLDALGTNANEFIQENALTVIESILGDLVARTKDNIESLGMNVTGGIGNIQIQSESNQVNVLAVPYLMYQDKGVSGTEKKYDTPFSYTDKMPPPSVFVDYIKTKNIQLRDNAKYYGKESPYKGLTKDKQISSAAWGMAKSIYKNGIKPKNFFGKEIQQTVDELNKELGAFYAESLVKFISNVKS